MKDRRVKVGLVMGIALAVCVLSGCRKQAQERVSPPQGQQRAVVTPQVVQPQPTPGEPTRTVECWDGTRVEIPAWAKFIGNARSGKFHRLTCEYVPSKVNHLYFKTRQEALGAGQVACRVCSP